MRIFRECSIRSNYKNCALCDKTALVRGDSTCPDDYACPGDNGECPYDYNYYTINEEEEEKYYSNDERALENDNEIEDAEIAEFYEFPEGKGREKVLKATAALLKNYKSIPEEQLPSLAGSVVSIIYRSMKPRYFLIEEV